MRLIACALLIIGTFAGAPVVTARAQNKPSAQDNTKLEHNRLPRMDSYRMPKEQEEAYARALKPLSDARQRAETLIEAGKVAEAERVVLDAMAAARQDALANPLFLLRTLGDIYLREGRNREALATFLEFGSKSALDSGLYLNICIAYCRLGDYRSALPYYLYAQRSNSSIWEYDLVGQAPRPQDWPGTALPSALQASALLARGISKQGTASYEDALRDFQAADWLAPGNPLIAYHAAMMLDDLKRFKEALPHYRRAAYCGNRFVAEQAKRKMAWLQTWLAMPHKPTAQPAGK